LLRGSLQMPFESPNRTKERVLTEGDQLWMMAQQEYDNPALWKPIAAANGILNPRKLGGITSLKVPSIK
ncbi:MAG: peptidoglycan-binding protein, partial [Angelakisella sp.]